MKSRSARASERGTVLASANLPGMGRTGLVLIVLMGASCYAAVRQVPGRYPSVQQAIDACNDGDTVVVAPGVYRETINFGGKDIVLTGTDPNDAEVVGRTVIDAHEDGTPVTFESGETSRAVLTGFTIMGGTGTLAGGSSGTYKIFQGGGIYCSYGSPTITHNVIVGNHLPYVNEQRGNTWYYEVSYGGGIFTGSGQPTITHNVIGDNSAYEGGGVFALWGAVADNVIYGNSAAYGGGVLITAGQLLNNTIVGNGCGMDPESGQGGNIYADLGYRGDLVVANNIICGATSGGGLFYSPKLRTDVIRFNDVWNNAPANYGLDDPRTGNAIFTADADWTGQFGNVSVDPVFVGAPSRDYHIAAGSPCISAGDPICLPASGTKDMDGDPRVFGLRVDIGADEYVGYVKPLAHAGDDQHVLAPGPISLHGEKSHFSDPNGVTTYEWSQTQGPAVQLSDIAAASPTFTAPSEGWYKFQLVVGDGRYTSGPDEVLVVVGNERPVADAGPDRLWPVPGSVTLDGSGSHDPDPPDSLTYAWSQIEGRPVILEAPSSPMPIFECNTPGIYKFQLVVHDGFVASEPDTVKIELSPFTGSAKLVTQTDYGDGYFFYPHVSGAKIVYTGGGWEDLDWNINCLDATTGQVQVFGGNGIDTMPRMDGNLIVWWGGPSINYRPICTSVFMVDVTSGQPQTLCAATSTESYGYPAISGYNVVWVRHRGVNTADFEQYDRQPYDICGADVRDPAKPVYFTVAEQVGRGQPYPYASYDQTYEDPLDISGGIVVWEGGGDIYGADISDLNDIKVFPICTAPERQYDPSISGGRVVWTDERNDAGDIYGADVSDPNNVREFPVYVGPGWQSQADIDGPTIVFLDAAGSSGDICTCCISRQYGVVPFSLAGIDGSEHGSYYGAKPQIDGSVIAWGYSYQVDAISFGFAYSLTDGPVENLATGLHYDHIQHGIDAAAPGDTIMARQGTYAEKLRFNGRRVTVTSTDPQSRSVRSTTVIEGPGQLVTFADGEDSGSVLTGVTVSGGAFGVYCSLSQPLICHCLITNNATAGVKLWGQANPTIASSEITANGVGVEMWAIRIGRVVRNNDVTLRNCVVAGNRKDGVWGGRPTLQNCTVADNLGYGVNSSVVTANSSIVYFNHQGDENLRAESSASVVAYSDVQGGASGQGNIDADPLFVSRGFWTDRPTGPVWTSGDYHLKSRGWTWDPGQGVWTSYDVTSPCIDAADPSLTLGEELVWNEDDPLFERAGPNRRIDMGAYGGTAEASLAPPP
jgi:beta propeller repeat protein